MYESPIEVFYKDIQAKFEADFENNCVKAVQSYGFNINKEELKKALLYDRNQYEKGFKDGITVPIYLSGFTNIAHCPIHSGEAYFDKARQLIFTSYITAELAKELGFTWEEVKEPFGGAT